MMMYIIKLIYFIGGQPIPVQIDPNDPTKWQVVGGSPNSGTLQVAGMTSPQGLDSPPGGKRLRRVACTCPNCRDNDGKGV